MKKYGALLIVLIVASTLDIDYHRQNVTLSFPAQVMAADSFSSEQRIQKKININTATEQELDAHLIGIGPVKAHKIIQYRMEHGPFQSSDDLIAVKGIGVKTLQKNRQLITVDK